MAMNPGESRSGRCKDSDGLGAPFVCSLHASLDAQWDRGWSVNFVARTLAERRASHAGLARLSNVASRLTSVYGDGRLAVQGADEVQLSAQIRSVMMKRERSERALGGAGQGVKAEAGVKHSPCDQSSAHLYKSADKREQNRERVEFALF